MTHQGKGPKKARFELLLWHENYDFLYRLAQAENMTMAATMNQILLRLRRGTPQTVPCGIDQTE